MHMKVLFRPNETFKDASVAFGDVNEANYPAGNLPYEYEVEIYKKMYEKISSAQGQLKSNSNPQVTWAQ